MQKLNNDYYVSPEGEVFFKGEKVRSFISNNGYVKVCCSQKLYSVHRLVAETYIPNPENKPQVNHIDGNKLNNSVENLEWCTRKQNMEHATRNGLTCSGERNFNAKLKRNDVVFIRSHPEIKRYELAKMFNVHPSTITRIRQGKRWTQAL